MKLIDCVWGGVPYFDESHFKDAENTFMSKVTDPNSGELVINGDINSCKSELDTVLLLKPYFRWKSVPEAYLTRFEKSSELSTLLRERANESYKTGNVIMALRGYNLAIAFSPPGSPEMGLAFGNRSALFVQMKEPSVAIRDIGFALENKIKDQICQKLLQRKEKCETLVQSIKDQNAIPSVTNMKTNEAQAYCDEHFFTLKNPNVRIPNAEDWVEIDFQEDRGRRLIATKNISAGELILIDKPFVSIINELLTWDLQHCHFCSKPLLGGIPCEKCTFTFYCDETCRNESDQGNHKYEHRYLSYLQSISLSHRELQALRLMGIVGPVELLTIFRNTPLTKLFCTDSSSSGIAGFNEQDTYDCNSYLPMYHLISHGMKDELYQRLSKTFKSIFLTRMLKEYSNFFSDIADKLNSEHELESFENFISSLVLRHIDNIRSNAIAISELKQSSTGEVSITYATAVYPLISLCNHSCDPNAAPIKKFKWLETALVTLKNLKPGDEIFITYQPLFTQMKTKERQEYLRNNYNFVCQCIACTFDWSLKSVKFTDIFESPRRRCSKCLSKDKEDVILTPCEMCVRSDLKRIVELEALESKLHDADEKLKKGEFVKAIEMLKPCLEYFTKNHSSCYSLTQVSSDLFKLALVRVVHLAQRRNGIN